MASRVSSDSSETFDIDNTDFESQGLTSTSYVHRRQASSSLSLVKNFPLLLKDAVRRRKFQWRNLKRPGRRTPTRRGLLIRRLCFFFQYCACFIFVIVLFTAIFRPSYTSPPGHYTALNKRILESNDYGRGNNDKEKVFIAASIYDKGGHLIKGAWGKAVLDLVNLLGNQNVFLSIYENDAGEEARDALIKFKKRVQCANSIVFERHVSLKTVPGIVLPDGSERTKRIAYLAAIRNRALEPLDGESKVKYDKLLFLNDVVFDPIEAVQLLFSTNVNENGKSSYLAACAVDFINPFKFYDTFATRDAEGYSMGVPFFPWFPSAGKGISRADVLHGKDAVRVKSCWGGMVAFDATYFQTSPTQNDGVAQKAENGSTDTSPTLSDVPIRFRAESDVFWEASECCLVHADLQKVAVQRDQPGNSGIYMNPYVRVAYGLRTLRWLRLSRRIERLYTLPHSLINRVAGMPRYNPRRTEIGGKEFQERVWVQNASLVAGGSFQEVTRVAENGGYCGFRTLQLIKDTVRKGEKNWETLPVPG